MPERIKGYILILNPGKCGSGWLAQSLSIQPYIIFNREFDFIYFLEFPLSEQWNEKTAKNKAYLHIREDANLSSDEKLLKLYAFEHTEHASEVLIIDKAPSNAYSGFEKYYHLYRDLKIILLYRDPRDIYVSNEFFHQHQLKIVAPRDDIGYPDYLRDNEIFHYTFLNCRKMVNNEQLLRREGIQYLRLTYEDLKVNFHETLWKTFTFLDLKVGPDSLVFSNYVNKPISLNEHVHQAQGFKPLFRKGVVGDWQNYFQNTESRRLLKEKYGDLLITMGYEKDYNW